MSRKSFTYQGKVVYLYDKQNGWRYYQSADETLKIKCKGLGVEQI